MESKDYKNLITDEEFKFLIPPLKTEEYQQLERNLILEGCRDPIVTWHNTIVDGHNRYEICNRLHIPYATKAMEFDNRECAIVWICSNQLGRRNISEETFKYLVGKQYETEKIIGFNRNTRGYNQYKKSKAQTDGALDAVGDGTGYLRTAMRIGAKHRLAAGTVQKYGKYTHALDDLGQKAPKLLPEILSGNYKVSHENVLALSRMDEDNLQKVCREMEECPRTHGRYRQSKHMVAGEIAPKPIETAANRPAIKNMPSFDPDAEIVGLSLTIPSWIGSIERTYMRADLTVASDNSKHQLQLSLENLCATALKMLTVVKGDTT